MVSLDEPPSDRLWRLSIIQSSIESPEGKVIDLTRKEVSLMQRFHLAPDQTLPLTILLEHFGMPATVEGKSLLAVRMSRLRTKIKLHSAEASAIKAHRLDGYQLLIRIQIF